VSRMAWNSNTILLTQAWAFHLRRSCSTPGQRILVIPSVRLRRYLAGPSLPETRMPGGLPVSSVPASTGLLTGKACFDESLWLP
jgi:hypothetical protein